MKAIRAIVAWFRQRGGFAHVVAGLFAFAVGAYSYSSEFRDAINQIYASMSPREHKIALLVFGLLAWYTQTNKKEKPDA